jgi:hypothetical protein
MSHPTIHINKTAFYPAPQKTLGILQKISPVFAKTQTHQTSGMRPRLCWCKGSARRKHHFA